MAPWRGEDISSFKRLTCHPKRLQPQGRAVPPGAGREGLWGELAQRLWTGGPPSSCSASLVTWPHPQWGGRGADLSHLPCSQTSPVPSPGDMLILAPSPGRGASWGHSHHLLHHWGQSLELGLGSASPKACDTCKGNRCWKNLRFWEGSLLNAQQTLQLLPENKSMVTEKEMMPTHGTI